MKSAQQQSPFATNEANDVLVKRIRQQLRNSGDTDFQYLENNLPDDSLLRLYQIIRKGVD